MRKTRKLMYRLCCFHTVGPFLNTEITALSLLDRAGLSTTPALPPPPLPPPLNSQGGDAPNCGSFISKVVYSVLLLQAHFPKGRKSPARNSIRWRQWGETAHWSSESGTAHYCFLSSVPLPNVIKFKFPLQAHHEYCITYGSLREQL